MTRRVLVIRSGREGEETARKLIARGFDAIVLPLTEIRRLPAIPMPEAGSFDAVAVTSANAVRLAPPELIHILKDKDCFAVGRHTAEVCEEYGLSVRIAGNAGGTALGQAILAAESRPAVVLFLCGRSRSGALESVLRASGVPVQPLEIYDSRPIPYTRDYVSAAMQWKPVWGAMLYSVQAAEELRNLATARAFSFLFENARYFCISERVAGAIAPARRDMVEVSEEPSECAMLEMLAARRPASLS